MVRLFPEHASFENVVEATEPSHEKTQDDASNLPPEPLTYRNVLELAVPEESFKTKQNQLTAPDRLPAPEVDPQFPEPSPDLKAYWRDIDDKIQELERLGAGSTHCADRLEEAGEEDEEDERNLLLRSALEELSGHELSLAADPETSVILERLIYSMDDFAKRVLADRFMGHFLDLISHRHASHVVQTLLALSAPVLAREAQGKPEQSNSKVDDHDHGDLPAMYLLLVQACEDVMPNMQSLSEHPTAAHVLLTLFLLVSGKPVSTEHARSRKSAKWRSKQGHLRSVFHRDPADEKEMSDGPLPVPAPLKKMGNKLYETIKSKWCQALGVGTRAAACNPATNTLLQILVGLEFDKGEAEKPGSMVDNLLDGLITSEGTQTRSEFVETCLRDTTASHVMECIISRLSPNCFSQFYSTYFLHRMGMLSNHPVTNFLTAKVVSRLDSDQFLPALQECVPKMIDCIDNYRTAVLQALVSRSKDLGITEQREVIQSLLRASGVTEDTEKPYIFPCLISLMRLDYFRKTTAFQLIDKSLNSSETDTNDIKLPDSNMQGSLLLQGILQLAVPDLMTSIVRSLMLLPLSVTMSFSRDAIASRALDSILNSPTVSPAPRRQFISRFIGHYHRLADDRVGSRIADLCWAVADVFTKEKIASSLVDQQNALQQSAYGHYFVRKLELPYFERQRNGWKAAMLQKFPSRKVIALPIKEEHANITTKITEESKGNEKENHISRPMEVDEPLKKSTKPKKKKIEEPAVDVLDDLFEPIIKKRKKNKKKSDEIDQ
ncbi:armadillo-type protein [Melampsora americana]|nr:armadillo-type protein [Melampsora americana]